MLKARRVSLTLQKTHPTQIWQPQIVPYQAGSSELKNRDRPNRMNAMVLLCVLGDKWRGIKVWIMSSIRWFDKKSKSGFSKRSPILTFLALPEVFLVHCCISGICIPCGTGPCPIKLDELLLKTITQLYNNTHWLNEWCLYLQEINFRHSLRWLLSFYNDKSYRVNLCCCG